MDWIQNLLWSKYNAHNSKTNNGHKKQIAHRSGNRQLFYKLFYLLSCSSCGSLFLISAETAERCTASGESHHNAQITHTHTHTLKQSFRFITCFRSSPSLLLIKPCRVPPPSGTKSQWEMKIIWRGEDLRQRRARRGPPGSLREDSCGR